LATTYHQDGLAAAQAVASNRNLVVEGELVQVVVLVPEDDTDSLGAAVQALGGTVQGAIGGRVQALIPISGLEALASEPVVEMIREPDRAQPESSP
jgi:hypothetical protein